MAATIAKAAKSNLDPTLGVLIPIIEFFIFFAKCSESRNTRVVYYNF